MKPECKCESYLASGHEVACPLYNPGEATDVIPYDIKAYQLGLLMIDPTNPKEFGEFAVEAWKAKLPNLRRVIDLWHTYLEHGCTELDIRKDPASHLIVALLAHELGLGVHDVNAVRAAVEGVRAQRN